MDEKRIITDVCAGATDSFSLLVERYQVGLIIYCDRIVGDRMEAEDIAQKSFIKAYQKLATFNSSKGSFSTWLYKIAANEALDALRKTKRVMVIENIEEIAPSIPDMLSSGQLREVRDAVRSLTPPERRMVIEAFYWEGKSGQTIADEMGVPLNTIKSWLRRAKLQLRKELA